MQNRILSLFVPRSTVNRSCFYTLYLLLMLSVCQLLTSVEARAEFIDFSEYPEETFITDQYKDMGIIFSAAAQPPVISHPDYFGVNHPALYANSASDKISLSITFVDPKSGDPAEATSFKIYYYAALHSTIKFTFYNLNGEIINQHEFTRPKSDPEFESPSRFHKFVVTSSTSVDRFWLDWIKFQVSAPSPVALLQTVN
jgi:hypothetical protein